MWKSRTSSSPARPSAGTAKRVDPPRPQSIIPNNEHHSQQQRNNSPDEKTNSNSSPTSRPVSAVPNHHHHHHSPSISNRRLHNNNDDTRRTATSTSTSRRPSPSPQRTATTDPNYWSSLSRHQDSHQQLRDEISSLRCRIQKAEFDKRTQEAQREKYNRLEKLFQEAKKTRKEHSQISQMRKRASSQRNQSIWQEAQEQHQKTKLRMLKLFQEKHNEVKSEKDQMNQIKNENQHWKDHNDSLQRKHVEELRQDRQINKLRSAAEHARHIQQCRDEFHRDVGSVTKQLQQYQDQRVENLRHAFEQNRVASSERRTNARQNWVRSNMKSKEEVAATLEKAKSVEAKMLLEEKRYLLSLERKLASR